MKIGKIYEELLKKNIIKTNLLTEGMNFEEYIINTGFSPTSIKQLNIVLSHAVKNGMSDFSTKQWIDDVISSIKRYEEEDALEKNKNAERKFKIDNILNNGTLLGKKIVDYAEYVFYLEGGFILGIDEHGNDNYITYANDDYSIYKRQSGDDSYGFKNNKDDYNKNPEDNNVIFPTKQEAKKFLDYINIISGKPKNIKLQFIYTPDLKENKSFTEDSFKNFNGRELTINNYDNKPEQYFIKDFDFSRYDFNDIDRYSIRCYLESKTSTYFSNQYALYYEIELGVIKKTKKEKLTFEVLSYPKNYDGYINNQPEVLNLVQEIKNIFK